MFAACAAPVQKPTDTDYHIDLPDHSFVDASPLAREGSCCWGLGLRAEFLGDEMGWRYAACLRPIPEFVFGVEWVRRKVTAQLMRTTEETAKTSGRYVGIMRIPFSNDIGY